MCWASLHVIAKTKKEAINKLKEKFGDSIRGYDLEATDIDQNPHMKGFWKGNGHFDSDGVGY